MAQVRLSVSINDQPRSIFCRLNNYELFLNRDFGTSLEVCHSWYQTVSGYWNEYKTDNGNGINRVSGMTEISHSLKLVT